MKPPLALVLLCFAALPAQAQLRTFDDPTVWISASSGFFVWAPASVHASERDNVVHDFSVSIASPNWMIRGGAQISDQAYPTVFEIPEIRAVPDGAHDLAVTYRTVYATVGTVKSESGISLGAALGPAVTWGTRMDEVPSSPCPPDVENCARTLELGFDSNRYLNLGLAGSVQGFVRLDGRVWLGGETMLVANASSSHLATRFTLRVDLLRPGR